MLKHLERMVSVVMVSPGGHGAHTTDLACDPFTTSEIRTRTTGSGATHFVGARVGRPSAPVWASFRAVAGITGSMIASANEVAVAVVALHCAASSL